MSLCCPLGSASVFEGYISSSAQDLVLTIAHQNCANWTFIDPNFGQRTLTRTSVYFFLHVPLFPPSPKPLVTIIELMDFSCL